jgi:hypothetical protein
MAFRQGEAHEHEDPPGEEADVPTSLVRRVLAHSQTPEERLEALLVERRRELEEQAERIKETVDDLERREQLLRDSRASVERLLRVGTKELNAREAELIEQAAELTARGQRLAADEADLARRRSELGAVELRREAVERRERALAEREEQLAAREAVLESREAAVPEAPAAPQVELAFVHEAGYRLVEIEAAPLERGVTTIVEGREYRVARVGPSPLPGDERRCAYVEPGSRDVSSSAGSS